VKPDDQVPDLTEKDLSAEHTRMLTADNPRAPHNVVRYKFKELAYRPESLVPQTCELLAIDGNLIPADSDEARIQAQEAAADASRAQQEAAAGSDGARKLRNQFNFSVRGAQSFAAPPKDRAVFTEAPRTATLRAAVTQWAIHDAYVRHAEARRDAEVVAEQRKRRGRGRDDGDGDSPTFLFADGAQSETRGPSVPSAQGDSSQTLAALGPDLPELVRLCERMVNQNACSDIIEDFRYWEDPADALREDGSGSLLPLWSFGLDLAAGKTVTGISWHPHYQDLFAVSYGTFQFSPDPTPSVVAVFSLKNPSYPLFVLPTACDATCIQWHPVHLPILAVGLYDGSLIVFNVAAELEAPTADAPPRPTILRDCRVVCRTDTSTGKHSGPVWSLAWSDASLDTLRALSLWSTSTDGTAKSWRVVSGEVTLASDMRLVNPPTEAILPSSAADANSARSRRGSVTSGRPPRTGVTETAEQSVGPAVNDTHARVAGGTCLQFSPSPASSYLFAVGTDTGSIRLCSKAYASDYILSMHGHSMPVYSVAFNTWEPGTLISCSEDWRIKIWSRDKAPKAPASIDPHELASFDLGVPVQDVAWNPAVCTGFAATTLDGRVVVYDVNVSSSEPLCDQQVTVGGSGDDAVVPTRLAFSPTAPVLLVGTSAGEVICLKLSPNLHKTTVVEQPRGRPGQPPPPKLTDAQIEEETRRLELEKMTAFKQLCWRRNVFA
jgi:dynein intermediate chain 1